MATTTPRRTLPSLLRSPPIRDFSTPATLQRLPRWLVSAGLLAVLLALSAYIRSRYLAGELWSDEANSIGIASHSLSAIPGILRQGGGAPLYFIALHLWMSAFGTSESAVHGLSLAFALATIPVGMWAGWSLFGRRAGYYLAALLAFSAFLTEYADEARPYELLALLGLLASACFLHGFVYRRRSFVAGFAAALVAMLYTDAWAVFFAAGAAVALVPVCLIAGERRPLARDALAAFAAAAVLYLPWLPTLIHQARDATAPWHYAPLLGANIPRNLLGSDRVDALLAIVVVAGLLPLAIGERRRTPEAAAAAALLAIAAAALLLGLLSSALVPDWAPRYFAPLVAPVLIVAAMAGARTGILGLFVVVVYCAFLANAASFVPQYKSDMKDVAAEVDPYLRPGDEVLVAQPEQAPLASYYLLGGLRYATTLGPAGGDPSYMDWDGAYGRLQRATPARTLARVLAGLRPGQRLLYIRPLTEGEQAWSLPWSRLVQLRAAQWGRLLAVAPELRRLAAVWAPHSYRGSCCVSSSALLFTRR
jgi:mannosyltransferase